MPERALISDVSWLSTSNGLLETTIKRRKRQDRHNEREGEETDPRMVRGSCSLALVLSPPGTGALVA